MPLVLDEATTRSLPASAPRFVRSAVERARAERADHRRAGRIAHVDDRDVRRADRRRPGCRHPQRVHDNVAARAVRRDQTQLSLGGDRKRVGDRAARRIASVVVTERLGRRDRRVDEQFSLAGRPNGLAAGIVDGDIDRIRAGAETGGVERPQIDARHADDFRQRDRHRRRSEDDRSRGCWSRCTKPCLARPASRRPGRWPKHRPAYPLRPSMGSESLR